MTATFQSLRETRLPKAEKAVGLLKNLVRYDHCEHEAKDLVNDLYAAADEVDAKFAKRWGWKDEEPSTHERVAGCAHDDPHEIIRAFRECYPETKEVWDEYSSMYTDEPFDPDAVTPPDDVDILALMQREQRKIMAHTAPSGTAEGGASFEAEVRWALDAIKRGDKKLAEDRLKRILKGE